MLWITLGLLALIVLYVLFVPLILYIDTDERRAYLQIKGLAKASIEAHETELIRIRLDTLFTHFYFYPIRKIFESKEGEKTKAKDKKRNRSKKDTSDWMRYGKIGRRLLQSFQVRKFRVAIDTGDCIQNARLFPVAAFVDRYLFDFQVNYQDRNYLGVHLANRPVNILKAFINP
ncbi:hypothetical protein [Lentiprolixibacter aurantiacus]|uniref:Uncharacterized protein n=1 Tax=Lentiprolixibacter aurantiacus TaxID=2993939 RepID=A0AAE3MLN2_9FLAO|nr:hypothetical protein [Lentiprolixibacter aurantiacus]MCX2719616.1 hypothetical protein [Lentiprolixibacter aurantiacus]